MAVNMTVDMFEDKLRAIRRAHADTQPDRYYVINDKEVNVWLEVDNAAEEDVENLVWITVVRLGDSWSQ